MVVKLGPRRSRLYWGTWVALLVLTAMMLAVDSSPGPRLVFVAVLLGAMLAKAVLIGAHFMHLRFERASLAVMVIIGLLMTGAILFVLIAPDALRIAAMTHPGR
ncbi:MAG: cytochrome C oxidase subunit IV family protein [Acidobacteria bacterium]|nr:cytochrome C oxidase subunit IV family protein [Acidobacteriota bacterium]MBI3261769.1 cytochrome C oxidase subunit IV family protein [Acidobacteriota bacterium]